MLKHLLPVASHCCSGFIALTSAVLMSAMLLMIAVGAGLTGLYARYNMLDSELKEASAALADACMDTVRLRMAADPLYTGSETLPVGSETCRIFASPDAAANPRPFVVQGIYHRSYTTYLLAIDPVTLDVMGRREVVRYEP